MAEGARHNTIDAGKLRFHPYYRSAGSDYGPAVEVFAEIEPGKWKEVLRYDCFAHEPHRHYFRADGVEDRQGYPGGIAESVALVRQELTDVPGTLARIGYDDLARELAAGNLQEAVASVDGELVRMEAQRR
jgi:hypothetical protein